MAIRRHRLLLGALMALALGTAALNASAPSATAEAETGQLSFWRVSVDGPEDAQFLFAEGYDVLEAAGDGFLYVLGDNPVAERLQESGFVVEFERPLVALPQARQAGSTFYNGYLTSDANIDRLFEVEAAFPALATVHDYGDSWNKINGRSSPNDLFVICLTNKQPGDCTLDPAAPKPRAVIMAAIHSRELQTSEVAQRLIDELTENYGTDPDITHLMDTTETWIIPVANPDGREIVETGGNSPYLQRKNANDTVGNCLRPPSAFNQHGVDLNRNSPTTDWGTDGTSSNPCAQTYPGTSPASEPEVAALETLFEQLWPDQPRGLSVPATADTTGTFISIHSFGNLILYPGGTPNDAGVAALGFRMSEFNGYRTGSAGAVLYSASGTTDDWTYEQFGVPSYTYELSARDGSCSGFTPAYSCVDSELWPLNRDALLYSIRVAHTPYLTARGPSTISVSGTDNVLAGDPLTLAAVVDDDTYGNQSDRPASSAITAVEYYIDASDIQGGTPTPMAAADGVFNERTEGATVLVPTADLSPGEHTAFVRGQNAAGYWGPVLPFTFTVTANQSTAINQLEPTVTCLAGNGRIDLNIVNEGNVSATYVLTVGSLTPRQQTVAPQSWWRSPVTGRPDGPLQVTLARDGITVVDTIVTVRCDTSPVVSPSGVQWFTWCIGDRGMIFAQMSNPEPTPTSYVLDVNGLRRSTTAAAHGAAVRGISGRADGSYSAQVEIAGTVIDSTAVVVDCIPD